MNKKIILLAISFTSLFLIKASAQTIYSSYIFKGTKGNTKIVMTFLVPDHFYDFDQGSYYSTKNKKTISFKGPAMLDIKPNEATKLIETTNGKQTGYFLFNNLSVLDANDLTGKWYSMNGKTVYPVQLKFFKVKNP